MEPYAELAHDRRVVFHDQLGCGNSAVTGPHDPAMWTTELFLREVDAVRAAVGLDRCHVIGHSWGGMLAMAYAATGPVGLASMTMESSPASVRYWLTEIGRLRSDLPHDVEAVLRKHEDAGTTDSAEYQATMMAFYDRHVCRVRPWPAWLQRTFDGLDANSEVYNTMNGPSEFHVVGPLKDFDITADLGRIRLPTLLLRRVRRSDPCDDAPGPRWHSWIAVRGDAGVLTHVAGRAARWHARHDRRLASGCGGRHLPAHLS